MIKNKILKFTIVTCSGLVVLLLVIYFLLAYRPQIAVSVIQSLLYPNGAEINPRTPKKQTNRQMLENGQLYVNDIQFSQNYPNSFLDITYPNKDTSSKRPTIVYFHGGGFFGGDKVLGDPLAEGDGSQSFFSKFVAEGYNFVNVNYVLVPEYHFPDPIIQMNEALNYLVTNADDLGLNMQDVTLFGQSAGAIMVSQYGAILSNSNYRQQFNLSQAPKLTTADIRGLIIDDAPLDMYDKNATFKLKLLIANYTEQSIYFENRRKTNLYNSLKWLTPNYPRAFVTAGTADGFPYDMKKMENQLKKLGVEVSNFETPLDIYGPTKHGYLSNLKQDKSGAARDAYQEIIRFLAKGKN
ncbi:alpha/beta hydrolase [Streptococcus cuniculipharyngis]|uniref:Alpha/beta hydrolase n=1 Tax=Streptococcus cuniculipharyngis TaxID=1562651 RepID=A0A5C5S8W6_9STRE|nr:alpha/beta hydrolase [Streptococcus cuniculipharyngis]TWS96187.1 alpha/beta hydrolase [Streptococcus cuniculipharyngis]